MTVVMMCSSCVLTAYFIVIAATLLLHQWIKDFPSVSQSKCCYFLEAGV